MSFLPKTRVGLLWRAFLAAVLVIGFAAGTTAVAGLLQVGNLANELGINARDVHGLTLPAEGKPETILLIGSDHRAGDQNYSGSQTDTMLLVRIDDASQTINMMSVPRDLEVLNKAGVPVKLNSIYEDQGGPTGLLKVMKQQIFPGLQVNHVVDTNFTGFSNLIDAIGCVYTDVDHRYYNVSQPAPSPDNYSSINIQPGYQKLCGGVHSATGTNSALAFVRFRHTDSDEVRNARQQDFIRWAKDGYSTTQLLDHEGKLVHIFSKYTQPDKSLASTPALIELFELVLDADSHSLKTIPFPEYFGSCNAGGQTPCYVYPCPQLSTCSGYGGPNPPIGKPTQATEAAYKEFITPTKAPAAKPGSGASAKPKVSPPKAKHVRLRGPNLSGLTADSADGIHQASELGNVGFPIYYPKYIVAGQAGVTSGYCFAITGNCNDGDEPATAYTHSYPRRYVIHGNGSHHYRAYVMTLALNMSLGEYYTVQGTTWTGSGAGIGGPGGPPILSHPSKVVHTGGKELYEYDDGSKIALVAYRAGHAVYWISNTLANTIPNTQMIGMAAELTRYTGKS